MTIFTGTAACVLGVFAMFDRVLSREHERHHEVWISDGKPSGFFWYPADGNYFSSGGARDSLFWSWLFTVPRWAHEEPEVKEELGCMRRLVFTSWVGWVLIALMFGFAT